MLKIKYGYHSSVNNQSIICYLPIQFFKQFNMNHMKNCHLLFDMDKKITPYKFHSMEFLQVVTQNLDSDYIEFYQLFIKDSIFSAINYMATSSYIQKRNIRIFLSISSEVKEKEGTSKNLT